MTGVAEIQRGKGLLEGAKVIGHELFHFDSANIFGTAKNEDEADAEEKTAKGVEKLIESDILRRTDDDICREGCTKVIGESTPGHSRLTLRDGLDTSDPLTGK